MWTRYARPVAFAATLLIPLGLLHAFVLAEICIGLVDALFLADMLAARNMAWARQPWFILAMLWWVWLLICSTPAFGFATAGWGMAFLQAFVILRFIIFTAALQNWVLTSPFARHAAWAVLALACAWVGIEAWQQFLTGRNIFGNPRWPDGALTGPFWKPRAGVLYAHLLFIALLPVAMTRPGKIWRLAAAGLMVIAVATSVLIGQRMGTAFTILGIIIAAWLFPPLRRACAAATIAGALVLLATPLISPPTHAKLVVETAQNMGHFTASPYGQLYIRAITMGLASPWHGWGYNGFRAFCPQDRFATGFPGLGIAPTQLALGACNLHPHNFYVQAFADAGFPGLALFIALNAAWFATLARGLHRNPAPLRAGLFIASLTFIWPFASTDAFPTLYEPGWMFFILGFGLALSRTRSATPA